jgi:hypothetical protein
VAVVAVVAVVVVARQLDCCHYYRCLHSAVVAPLVAVRDLLLAVLVLVVGRAGRTSATCAGRPQSQTDMRTMQLHITTNNKYDI